MDVACTRPHVPVSSLSRRPCPLDHMGAAVVDGRNRPALIWMLSQPSDGPRPADTFVLDSPRGLMLGKQILALYNLSLADDNTRATESAEPVRTVRKRSVRRVTQPLDSGAKSTGVSLDKQPRSIALPTTQLLKGSHEMHSGVISASAPQSRGTRRTDLRQISPPSECSDRLGILSSAVEGVRREEILAQFGWMVGLPEHTADISVPQEPVHSLLSLRARGHN
jgi:hypothetical protein